MERQPKKTIERPGRSVVELIAVGDRQHKIVRDVLSMLAEFEGNLGILLPHVEDGHKLADQQEKVRAAREAIRELQKSLMGESQ